MNIADRRALRIALFIALLLHMAMLIWARHWLQAPSPFSKLPPPFYTRLLHPQAVPIPVPAPPPVHHRPARHRHRPVTFIEDQPVAVKSEAVASDTEPAASAPESDASVARAVSEPAAAQSAAPVASDAAALAASQQAAADVPAAVPSQAASATPPAFIDTWPPDTRLTYVLNGNYRRGQLHGSAHVLWQRLSDGQHARYETQLQLSIGFLLSMRLTSQGKITEHGLAPKVYEQVVGQHQRVVFIDEEDVRLNNGKHAPKPDDVQDTASQFIELAHRCATGQVQLAPGGSVHLWLARPTAVDEWVYDVLNEETLYLPRLGAVQAIHLKPRPLNGPSGSISAEIWLAPSLQYLPVRILLTQDSDSSADLLVDTIEQQ